MLALQDTFGMNDDTLVKAASAMSGGIGGMYDSCGALLGAAIMLGGVCGSGRDDVGNMEKSMGVRTQTGKLYKWFEKEYGATACQDIRKNFGGGVFYEWNIPWQMELAKEAGVMDKCRDMVEKTAAGTAEMIYDEMKPGKKKPEEKKTGGH